MCSSVCALPSPASAEGCCPSLFGWFTGTTAQSDFSCTFMSAVRFMAFADRSWSVDQDVQEISRFSCMLFLSVRGFLDYAGPSNPLAITWLLCCLPPLRTESASCSIGFSKLNSPAHRYLCLRFKRYLATSPARLEARMDSLLSFPVGLFHPLVGSRTGAILRRCSLSVAPRFLWKCLTSRTVSSFPALASSNPSRRFPTIASPPPF